MKKIVRYSIVFAIGMMLFTEYIFTQKYQWDQVTTVKVGQEKAQDLPFLGKWRIIE